MPVPILGRVQLSHASPARRVASRYFATAVMYHLARWCLVPPGTFYRSINDHPIHHRGTLYTAPLENTTPGDELFWSPKATSITGGVIPTVIYGGSHIGPTNDPRPAAWSTE